MNLRPALPASLVAVSLGLLLPGCNRAPAPVEPAVPAAGTLALPAPASPITQSVAVAPSTRSTPAAPATTATPTTTTPVSVMDCARTEGPIESMVCEDTGLSVLDRQLADVYAQALEHADDKITLRASQRGWIKGRNDCWKAKDPKACVRTSYQTRIVDLRIQHGLVTIPRAIEYACNDNSVPFSAAFYTEDPRAAVLTYGNDQTIAIATPTASGTRYVTDGVDFREQAGKATVDFYGNKLDCTAKP